MADDREMLTPKAGADHIDTFETEADEAPMEPRDDASENTPVSNPDVEPNNEEPHGTLPAWLQPERVQPEHAAHHGVRADTVIRQGGTEGTQREESSGNATDTAAVLASAASGAAQSIGSFFSEGAAAVREMNAARKAHAEAREQLETIERTIADEEAELAHRRDVAVRFDAIIAEQTNRLAAAQEAEKTAQHEQTTIQAAIDSLKEELERIKADDAQTEKRLKATLDAAEAKEASAREAGQRLQRRLDDAERNVKKCEEDRSRGIAAAQEAVESAKARLATLREEFTEVQRNPSANSAAYSVRATELEAEISDATHELKLAEQSLPTTTEELERALNTAKALLAEAKKPIDAAKQEFAAIRAAADDARDTYQEAKEAAAERQRSARDNIAEQEKAKRAQAEAEEAARDEAADAQSLIDEANDIHAHPEITEAIAGRLEADRAEQQELTAEVAQLAAAEQDVRDRTRGSRLRFVAVIAAIVVVIALIALAVAFLG